MGLPDKCPLCKAGREAQGVLTAHVFGAPNNARHAFFHCGACDVRYLHPGLSPEEEARFYVAEFESFMASRSGKAGGWHRAEEHITANETTRLRRMKYLEPHLAQAKDVLEIGCSSGFMVLPLAAAGKLCTGVEPSGIFGEFLLGRGLPVYPSLDSLLREDTAYRFDIIMHFFVLEHISNPLEFLRTQLDLLRPGGKLVFEIPNVADPLCSIYDIPGFERFYWSIAHPWYFSEASLGFLLGRLGYPYEILRDQRYDLSNHMVWARDGRPGGMGRFTEFLGPDVEDTYKQALIRSGHCDTLIGVISKV